jgi:hypothetical protein
LTKAEENYEVMLPGEAERAGMAAKQPGTGAPKQKIREGMGDPKPPSGGGEGELNARGVFAPIVKRALPIHFTRLVNVIKPILQGVEIPDGDFVKYVESVFGDAPPSEVVQAREAVLRSLTVDGWWKMSSEGIQADLGLQDRFSQVAVQIRNQLSDAQYITGAERPTFPALTPLPVDEINAFTGQLAETYNDTTAFMLSALAISRTAHMLYQDAELTETVAKIREDFLESLALRGELASEFVRNWLVEKHSVTIKESTNV